MFDCEPTSPIEPQIPAVRGPPSLYLDVTHNSWTDVGSWLSGAVVDMLEDLLLRAL